MSLLYDADHFEADIENIEALERSAKNILFLLKRMKEMAKANLRTVQDVYDEEQTTHHEARAGRSTIA